MAFSFFGKKDKNPPQAPEPVAKTPPTPPKIQTPPTGLGAPAGVTPPPDLPTVKPPQPSGLMPAVGVPRNTVTTQPMSMSRPPAPPTPSGSKNRSTQRLVVTPNAAGKMTSTRPLAGAPPSALINLPAGMILRCLPPEMLTSDLAQFEASGAAATEIGLPMNAILSQLPSGKVEFPAQELIAHFPPGFLKTAEELAPLLGTVISLPLMDVVMRIPPDLLSVRPDQKDATAAAGHMADPFTEDSLRQPAPPPVQANIVDESQVAHAEEFVPRAATISSFIPPVRNVTAPLLHQTASLSGKPAALRATTPMPGRILPPLTTATSEVPMPPRPPQLSASQILGVPRPSLAAPAPPVPSTPPAPFTFTPPAPAASALTPSARSVAPTIPMVRPVVPEETPAAAPETPAAQTPAAPAPDTNADELQRLAALAMAETGDKPAGFKTDAVPAVSAETAIEPEPVPAPAPENLGMEKTILLPPPPARVEPGFAATSRFGLPESPARELAQTTPVVPAPTPVASPSTAAAASRETGRLPGRPELSPRSITSRFEPPAPTPAPAAINLNTCTAEELLPIPGIGRALAVAIVQHRTKIGEFQRLDQLLDVPGMTRDAYANLTGEAPPTGLHASVNELLGYPADKELSLKDVTDRIACWPDVTGCLLSQKNGLPLVGTAPEFLDRAAIGAFAPRIFEDLNKSFGEITGRQTEELVIPTTGTSFHLMRDRDLYLIILSRVPQMPDRHLKIARMVLAGLSVRPS
jgi:competence ComEA-like helix-hairpin-helix protein